MSEYRVHLVQTVSTTVEVEADDMDQAIEAALNEAPSPTNSTNTGIDPSGDWMEVAVYDESGDEVWSESDDREAQRKAHEKDWQDQLDAANAMAAELRAEVEKLRPIAARAQSAENWDGTGECPVCGEVSS